MNQHLTVAQALITFLQQQYVSRDGNEQQFFAGCFGIFGHGNVAGLGQALHQTPGFRFIMVRNEQAMVHTAAAYAKTKQPACAPLPAPPRSARARRTWSPVQLSPP